MRVLFIGGVFDPSREAEILKKNRTGVEYAANRFQLKLIRGLKEVVEDIRVVSAPFLGAWPNAYNEIVFRGFRENANDQSGYEYVSFLNVWGFRNPSRTKALKRQIRAFAQNPDPDKVVVIYSPHTPFLQAANYLKRLDKTIKTCLVVPDLPQYMNLADKVSPIYKIMKKLDIRLFEKECAKIDSFVLLTEPMKDSLQVGNRPYAVVEGIYEVPPTVAKEPAIHRVPYICYTGKLEKKFGILTLLEAFSKIDDPTIRLVICGSGEAEADIRAYAKKDGRVDFVGQVSSQRAMEYTQQATVLVNPRPNNSEYTKYSFPSKTIEYLATGNPVVAYMLDGMPEQYRDFIFPVTGDSPTDLADALRAALAAPVDEVEEKSRNATNYLTYKRSETAVASLLITLCKF